MKVRFKDGVVKDCTAPTEQKIFKSVDGKTGWMLMLRLIGEITSTELDNILTTDNIATLEFFSEDNIPLFTLDGYDKITSSTIRHSEDTTSTSVEIQLTKGV